MKRIALFVVALFVFGEPLRAQSTPGEIIDQIGQKLEELKKALEGQPQPTPQAPPVSTASELHEALKIGGVIECSGDLVGNFIVSKPTTLRGSGYRLESGQRVQVGQTDGCQLLPADRTKPTLSIPTSAASDSQVLGLRIHNAADNPVQDAVVIGTYNATQQTQQPSNILFRHIVMVAGPNGGRRAIVANASNFTLADSYCSNYWDAAYDSQCVLTYNTNGPITLVNNFLEASGENFMSGGADAAIPNGIPSDIRIEGNDFFKRPEWRDAVPRPSVKNLLELKNAQRVTIERNTFDGNWLASQFGSCVLFTVRNQGGKNPWATVNDVVFARNVVKNCTSFTSIDILGKDDIIDPVTKTLRASVQMKRIRIEGNLFLDQPRGIRISGGVTEELAVVSNTWPAIRNSLLHFDGSVKTVLRYENNVGPSGEYGVFGGSGALGPGGLAADALKQYTVNKAWTNNIIEKTPVRTFLKWPEGTVLLEPGTLGSQLDPQTFKYIPGGSGY